MNAITSFIVWGMLSYFLGGIPFGYLFSRIKGIDIRQVGSGNIGATNVFRSVGKHLGILTFSCDVLKGFIPACIFPLLSEHFFSYSGGPGLSVLCACLAIAGHNWPVYLRFKGGKGIATSGGALLGIAPASAGIGLLIWVLVFGISRYVSVASLSAVVAVVVSAWFFYIKTGFLVPIVLTCIEAVAAWRHKENIRRLFNGTELRFQLKKNSNSGTKAQSDKGTK